MVSNTKLKVKLNAKVVYLDSLELISLLILILASAACIAKLLWTSGGIRAVNLPEKRLIASGSGICSLFDNISEITSSTRLLIPHNASSLV